jgi:hypothetical protein
MIRKFEIKVGMPVWLEPIGNIARNKKNVVYPGFIRSIGRKYFHVDFRRSEAWGQSAKFDLEHFKSHLEDCNSGYILYDSLEAFKAEKAHFKKLTDIESAITYAKSISGTRNRAPQPSADAVDVIYNALVKEGLLPEWTEPIYYDGRGEV